MRRGNTIPASLKIPTQVPEEAEAKMAPAISMRPCDVSSSSSPSPDFSLPGSPQPFEVDTDAETTVGTESSTTATSATTITGSCAVSSFCTDFSNYLGISLGSEAGTAPNTNNSDSFSRVTSVEDAYGWEAELDRKTKCEVASSQACYPYQCTRRNIPSKHNLLQRVFSMQPTRRVKSRS